jgi:FlaG/FlaF family flagellin (archaellin)
VRRFFAGIVVGVILMIAIPVMANAIIGKSVEGVFPVYLRGDKLAKDAVVIDSTSYLPVRVLGEALGLDVKLENGQVLLESKQDRDGKKIFHGYKINSNVLPIRTSSLDVPAFQTDGEIYVPTSILDKIYAEKLYEEGKLHRFDGRMFMRISDFGLKAVIKDGVMWLE